MKLKTEQEKTFMQIELSIILQRAVELMEELPVSPGNKKLKQAFLGIIPQLDKEVNRYSKMYEASAEVTEYYYNVSCELVSFLMKKNLVEKGQIVNYLTALEINSKAIEGIIQKVLKQ